MLRVEGNSPCIHGELEQVIKRLHGLRERFGNVLDELGIHMDRPEHAHPIRSAENPRSTGLSELRTAITEINTQIAYLEFEADRLFQAKTELFGVGDGRWHETNVPVETTPQPEPYRGREVRKGDFGAHP